MKEKITREEISKTMGTSNFKSLQWSSKSTRVEAEK